MLPAKFFSHTPRVIVFFLPALGRFVSRVAFRKSDRMPSEMSLISKEAIVSAFAVQSVV
jgi:hypothetical protein